MRNAHLHLKLVAHTLRGALAATAALPILLLSGRQTLFVSNPARPPLVVGSSCPSSRQICKSGLLHCIWLRMLLLPLLCCELQ